MGTAGLQSPERRRGLTALHLPLRGLHRDVPSADSDLVCHTESSVQVDVSDLHVACDSRGSHGVLVASTGALRVVRSRVCDLRLHVVPYRDAVAGALPAVLRQKAPNHIPSWQLAKEQEARVVRDESRAARQACEGTHSDVPRHLLHCVDR